MTIAWIYLDKKAATINALKDYATMEFIRNTYENRIDAARDRMFVCSSPAIGVNKSSANIDTMESRIAETIDELDILKAKYKRALEYMEWFNPAWEELHDDEQYILSEFYQNGEKSKNSAVTAISKHLFVEKSTIYKLKDKALSRLALLLYGK